MNVTFLNDQNQLNKSEVWRTGAPTKYGLSSIEQVVQTSLDGPLPSKL